jgi:hypothetical protein
MKQNKKHIEIETPILDSLQNKETFAVPQNYFDSLHDSIMSQTKTKENNSTKTIYFTPKRILAYAASVIVMVGLSTFMFPKNDLVDNELAFEDTSTLEYFETFTETEFDLENNIEFDEISIEF